ncbi:hypothetical protein E6H34_02690 [Candidatus Bathyarchaeota archaeon]|nr:MAG: hypothetical protein E6H34_02690 [Candidatus Bathyarchaeota archaeon]
MGDSDALIRFVLFWRLVASSFEVNIAMGLLHRADPFALVGSAVALFLALTNDPWWTITGAHSSSLLAVKVSPFYLETIAAGLLSSTPFTTTLGSLTRVLSILGFVALAAASIQKVAWWRPLVICFGLCALIELYFSFLLMHMAADITLLGAYGVIPPYSGTGYLLVNFLGLDLNIYPNPLVIASFRFPFYAGFLAIGLVGGGLILKVLRERGSNGSPGNFHQSHN